MEMVVPVDQEREDRLHTVGLVGRYHVRDGRVCRLEPVLRNRRGPLRVAVLPPADDPLVSRVAFPHLKQRCEQHAPPSPFSRLHTSGLALWTASSKPTCSFSFSLEQHSTEPRHLPASSILASVCTSLKC